MMPLYIGFVEKDKLITPPLNHPIKKSPFDAPLMEDDIRKMTRFVKRKSVYEGNVIVQWCYSCDGRNEYSIMGFLDPRWHGLGGSHTSPWFIRGSLFTRGGELMTVQVKVNDICRTLVIVDLCVPVYPD